MYKGPILLLLLMLVVKFCPAQNKDSLYVFVGEKISVHEFKQKADPVTTIIFDASFKAKYKVIRNVFNKYDKGTIEFEVYDHYGTPPFSKDKYVLLFVVKENGKWYHEKYIYFEVYQTINGKWASACNLGNTRFSDDYQQVKDKAIPLQFKKGVSFDLRKITPENIKLYFNAPYFKIENNRAIPLMGTYVDDLFKIEAEGILKNRGYFK